jgi:conjugative relaxase-like TrwC/TraI family protein
VLSTKTLQSAANTKAYFDGQENYYAGCQQNQWWGRGAQALGLEGAVDAKIFGELLAGQFNGVKLGRLHNGTWEHRQDLI